jgi:hypothetical protein
MHLVVALKGVGFRCLHEVVDRCFCPEGLVVKEVGGEARLNIVLEGISCGLVFQTVWVKVMDSK